MRVVELAHGCCLLEELDLVIFVVEHLDGHLLHHTGHVLPLPPTHHTKLPLPYLGILDHSGARDLLVLVLRELSVEVSLIVGWRPVVFRLSAGEFIVLGPLHMRACHVMVM